MRRLFFFLLAAFAAAFLWASVATTSVTHAATNAIWKDSITITYGSNDYSGPAPAETVKNIGLPDGDTVYTYLGSATDTNNRSTENTPIATPTKQLLYVIFFDKGIDVTTAKTAKYETVEYVGANTYKNSSKPIVITIDTANTTSTTTKSGSSCSVSGGLGWIICPISNFFAGALDKAYDTLSSYLNVKPIATDTNSTLFRAWDYMRNFANIAFVIAFLIIIYSQLTNLGISNYGIKKLLPRLIIAAILVNLSYYVCAIGVDISNVLGHSIQDVFISIRSTLVVQNTNTTSFTNTTGVVLASGTTLAVGGSVLVLYGVVGTIYLLLPVLITGFFAVLTALLVIAGRQALITVLVIISPLAFVAYLLPNTEKWFEKWRSTFMTLLILFPAFALVFGGSQLAAAAIIQNADSWNVVILALFVQLAPLMITPLLIRLSGSTLGKLADLANGPAKQLSGMANRFFREDLAATRMSDRMARENVGRYNPLGVAQRLDHNRRDRKFERDTNEGAADVRWKERSARYRSTDFRARQYGDRKAAVEGQSELDFNNSKLMPGATQTLDTKLRRINDENADSKATTDATYEVSKSAEFRNTPEWNNLSGEVQGHLDAAHIATTSLKAQTVRKQSAANVQQVEFAKALDNSLYLRREAGASVIDKLGEQRAQAAANSVVSKAHDETIANATSIIGRANFDDNQIVQIALGNNQTSLSGQFVEATDDTIEAAIIKIMSGGNQGAMKQLAETLPLTTPPANATQAERERLEGIRLAFTEGAAKSSNRPKYWGFGWLGQVNQGLSFGGEAATDMAIIKTINDGKLSAEAIVGQDKDALARILATIERSRNGTLDPLVVASGAAGVIDPTALTNFKAEIAKTRTIDQYTGKISELNNTLTDIEARIP